MANRRVVTASGVAVEFQDAVLCDANIAHFVVCRHHDLRLRDKQAIRRTGQVPETLMVFVCTCVRCNHSTVDLEALAADYVKQAQGQARQ